jgi:hypothetical protein
MGKKLKAVKFHNVEAKPMIINEEIYSFARVIHNTIYIAVPHKVAKFHGIRKGDLLRVKLVSKREGKNELQD